MIDFAAAYEAHADDLYRYIVARLGTHDEADDILSQTFLDALTRADRYEDRGYPVSSWLYRIAWSRVIDHRRRQQRHPTISITDWTATGPAPDRVVLDRVVCADMLESAALTPSQCAVIHKRFVERQSLKDTAQHLDKTVGEVKALQHRALARLAQTVRA